MDYCRGIGLWSGVGVLAVVLNLFCTPAEATMIEIEPDIFRVGTNLSNLFEGVTLNRYAHDYNYGQYSTVTYDSVYVTGYGAATGTHGLGRYDYGREAAFCWGGLGCEPTRFSALLLQFERPVNYVEVAMYAPTDVSRMYAFDANRQIIGMVDFGGHTSGGGSSSFWGGVFGRPAVTGTVQVTAEGGHPLIHSVVVAGDSGSTYLDRIRFSTVPEPSALLLLGMGVVGLVWWSRKSLGAPQAGGSAM